MRSEMFSYWRHKTLCLKKVCPWCLIITLANMDRFSPIDSYKNSLCIHHKDFHLTGNIAGIFLVINCWENFENWSTFAKVIFTHQGAYFLSHSVFRMSRDWEQYCYVCTESGYVTISSQVFKSSLWWRSFYEDLSVCLSVCRSVYTMSHKLLYMDFNKLNVCTMVGLKLNINCKNIRMKVSR